MKRSKAVLDKWSRNFRKSPLVNKTTGAYDRSLALQVFNGKSSSDYPEEYPHGFDHLYRTISLLTDKEAEETLLKYLHFIGITLSGEALSIYTSSPIANRAYLFKKAHYLFRGFAYASNLNIEKPFTNMFGDVDIFVRIETGQSQLSIFDEPLPQLYGRDSPLPEGYDQDPDVKNFFDQIENSNDSFLITGKFDTSMASQRKQSSEWHSPASPQ